MASLISSRRPAYLKFGESPERFLAWLGKRRGLGEAHWILGTRGAEVYYIHSVSRYSWLGMPRTGIMRERLPLIFGER